MVRGFVGVRFEQCLRDWSTPDTVRVLASAVFDAGGPFVAALGSSHQDLLDLKTIRNATAHMITTTQAALDSLATRKLQHRKANMTAAAVLLSTNPSSTPPETIFQSYVQMLLTLAGLIADA